VFAVGSVMRRPATGGAEHAHSIDTQAEAIAFDAALAEVATSRPALSIAVVGAGFTGIELALEMRDRIARHGGDGAGEAAKIVLIDRSATVGPQLGPGPRPIINAALAQDRVDLRLSAILTEITTTAATATRTYRLAFADGTSLDADLVVLTTGLVAAPLAERIPGDRDHAGRILVTRNLRAPGATDVFVTGDAAAADTGAGHPTMQSCQHALQLGRFAGENAARDLLGQHLVEYRQERYVTCLDLGRSGAVLTTGWERTVSLSGKEGKAVKRRINTQVIYPPADVSPEELLKASALPG
jgi:NADH:ubiquinone reductase (H+-translocating)